jgi:hypothetical protein
VISCEEYGEFNIGVQREVSSSVKLEKNFMKKIYNFNSSSNVIRVFKLGRLR